MDVVARQKPNLPWLAIFNMAVGFFGLQIGFALQNANASRIAHRCDYGEYRPDLYA